MIKAAVIGAVGTLIVLVLKKDTPEMALLLTITIGLFVMGLALSISSELLDVVRLAVNASGLSSAIFTPVIKCVGIGIVARIAADICRDGGQASIASSVELAGAVCALCAALPLIRTLLETISSGFS